MFEENENPVLDENTENVEETTEETVDEEVVEENPDMEEKTDESIKKFTFTEDELKEIKNRAIRRGEKKAEQKFQKKYGKAERILKAGMDVEDIEQAVDKMEDFYKEKGITIPKDEEYPDEVIEVLAQNEVNKMIKDYDFEDLEDEANNLANIGYENMTPKEKKIFMLLSEHLTNEKDKKDLASIGVKDSDLQSEDFKEFSKNLNPNLTLKEKYEIYTKYKPVPEVKPIGSLKNSDETNGFVLKDYYSFEEASKFTRNDFEKHPELIDAIDKSKVKWR